ncbi:MAG: hypothetical protein WCH99_00790 [Verrucomicrobiota bacterium]
MRYPFWVFGLVLLWRVALLAFTAQPIPANDAFFFDGPVVNYLLNGHYINPAAAEVMQISGRQVYSAYPPFYQAVLCVWMMVFGTSVLAAMWLHLVLFAVSGCLVLAIIKKLFPPMMSLAPALVFFFGMTFMDRPDDLGHTLGLLSLWLVARLISGQGSWPTSVALAAALFSALYSSVMVGTVYFGMGFLAVTVTWWFQRRLALFVPFVAAASLFAGVTSAIAVLAPVWWQGFLENSAQTPIRTLGLRTPHLMDILKLIRTAPLFLLAAALLPFVLVRYRRLTFEPWLALLAGVFLMGLVTLVATMTVISPDYTTYLLFVQVILAVGMLVLVEKLQPDFKRSLRLALLACALLISIRFIGMTTWGAACAWKNSYGRTQATLRAELAPFSQTNLPVIISSPYLYQAFNAGARRPIHFDWYYNHATAATQSDLAKLIVLRPPKLVLTQFDYYRSVVPMLDRLRQQPELVTVRVRDFSGVRPPDSIPSLQRVVQHISWAPVIVDLDWK